MKSFSRRRHSQPYVQAEALVDARNKVFNVIMAVLLVLTMLPITAFTYESQASAETLDSNGTTQVSEYSDDSSNSSGGSTSNSSATTSSGSSDGESSSSENADGGYPSTAVDPSDDNTQSGDTQNGSNGQNPPNDQGTSDDGTGASGQDDQGGVSGAPSDDENNSEENSQDDNSAADESADESEKQRDPMAWQSQLDATKLDASIAVETDKIDALENNQLPAEIPATLRVSFELTPGEDGLLKDDWIETTLPSFLSFENASLEVFRLNADRTETTEKIANAEIKDGVLKITFIDAAATEDTSATVRGYVDIEASLASSSLGEEESEQLWIAQTGEDGTQREVKLLLPTYQSVLDTWNEARSPLGMLGGALGITDGEVVAQDETAKQNNARVLPEPEVSVDNGSFNTQVHSQIIWCDNNSGNRPSTSSLTGGYIPQYSLDNGQTYRDLIDSNGRVTEQAKTDLYLNEEEVARIEGADLIQITQSAVNTYDVVTRALPGSLVTTTRTPVDEDNNGEQDRNDDGSLKYETSTSSSTIHWVLKDTNTYSGYVDGENSTWDKQYKMLTSPVEFTVIGKVGDKKLSEIFGEGHESEFEFGATIDGKPQNSITVAQAVEEGWLTITDTADGCVIEGDLPIYNEQGLPIVYFVKYKGVQEGKDYYQVSYDNSASDSHGSATDAVYVGGSMTLRHAGTTEYHGTKVWLDNDNAQRPGATFTLWRYSINGGSAATASQVSLSSLQTDANAASGYATVTIPAGGSSTVDLGQLLKDTYGDIMTQLPKYDPDGYPYVYALREDAIAGYEQVFGSVGANGTVTDTVPRYENEAGNGWIELETATRSETDRFIYNGGTISNRLTGTTTAEMTKTWEIAAFQDDLIDVVCTFTAQSRVKGSDSAWQNVDSADAVQTLTGWNAETLSKAVTESFPKYDSHGNELEYRWLETDVTLDGQDTQFQLHEDGTASFQLQIENDEGITETLEFTSTPVTTTADDGTSSTTITNTFANITDQHVDKYWEQPDGSLAQVAPDPNYSDGNATVELYRDGVLIGTYTMDGQTDSTATPITELGEATWQETRSYHIDFENLPKYSSEGKRYTYLVLETSKQSWNTERTYDSETRTTRIDNYFPEGEGSEIRVTKRWIDGDDAAHRLKVRVELVANHYMASQATNADGSPRYEFNEGQVVASVDLTAGELWFAEVDIPIGGLTYQDFTAVESCLIDDKGTESTEDDEVFYAATRSEAENNPDYVDEGWVNAGWSDDNNRRVATNDHVYEILSGSNDTLQAAEVSNRRLGLFDLTVTKDWADSLGDIPADSTDNPRPEAVLTLSCDENPNAFSLDISGNLQVSVSGNILPVTDADGNPVTATIVDDVEGDGTGDAQVTINRNSASSTYYFFGLPKYDGNGMNVHYSVNESWMSDAGDYRSNETVGDYIVEPGMRHFHDTQQVDFDNTRSGTRDVVFYKMWYDNYVSQDLNQRPDIYLTLYRVSENYSNPVAVPGYINFNWSAITEDGDAANEQMVTISDLAEYDDKGAEYTYYASESMSADGTSLNYAPVKFNYGSIQDVAEEDLAIKVDEDTANTDPTENGVGWAIHESGTFENRLDSDLEVAGTKLWENISGNVAQGDLPEITVYLQRKLASDAQWPEMIATKNEADGSWSVSNAINETSELTRVTTNQYTFSITTDHEGNALPRYDEYGNLYEYRTVEVIWGLENQPGGFTTDQLNGVDLNDVIDGTVNLVGNVYVVQHGESDSFLLRNVYGGETGNLTVKKLFEGREAGDLYPDVTFNVYRYYVNDEGTPSAPELAARHTITASDFQNDILGDTGNNSKKYTFTNLPVYAPDGSRWVYFVAEQNLNGYETVVGTGDLSVPDRRFVPGDPINAQGVVTDDGSGVAMRSSDLGNVDQTVIASDETVDVTFANSYEPGSADLKGTKVWHDYNNIFTVRPITLDLTLTRFVGNKTEVLSLNTTDPNGENYLTWTQKGETGDWTFTISNVEKWAPNGQAWTYTVTEDLSNEASQHYSIVVGSSSVSTANPNASFRLENALNGRASVTKSWVDGNDPYGLRPTTVTVQLQARTAVVQSDGTAGQYSGWSDAYSVWTQFASEEDLANQGFTKESTYRTLNADDNGWRGSWSRLPVLARLAADTALTSIQYRVVETQIGDQVISSPDENGDYIAYYPYQPDQVDGGNVQDGFTSAITNTLESTSITATKSWKDDADDVWDTRPGNGNTWSVTYFLQSKTNNTDWGWVVETDSKADPAGSATQDGVVSLTISGTGNDTKVTWENLPEFDASGNRYEYRVVEQVPGSYDISDPNAELIQDDDTEHRYYVVSNSGGSQTFVNKLRTVDLTGTKQWNDYGTGLANSITADDLPTMVLYRQIKGGTPEQVKMKNGTDPAQPVWSDADSDGVWTFVYSDLPAADKNDKPYTYWAVEQAGTSEGYYPTYGTSGADGTTTDGDQQTGTTITNVATRFTLDKVSDWDTDSTTDGTQGEQLRGIELTVTGADDKIYGVWNRDNDGVVTSTVWPDGTDDATQGGTVMTGNNAGYLVGLPAETYTISETSTPPAGYAKAKDVHITIAANGEVSSTDGTVTVDGTNPGGTITVKVVDPVLRGHLQLTKYVSEDGTSTGQGMDTLQGAKFDLYRVDIAGDADADDELIAEGLVTNSSGVITTVGNSALISKKSSDGTFDLTYGGKYITLADGLPEGDYYFKETDAGSTAVTPDEGGARSETLTIAQKDHYASTQIALSTQKANREFAATVELIKYDTSSLAGINGVEFNLKYRPEGSTATDYPVDLGTFTTKYDNLLGKDGVLTLSGLEKGDYLLTETKNPGYDITDDKGFSATFTLDNADHDRTFMVWQDAADAIDFEVTNGSIDYGAGVPNDRLTGQVTLNKRGNKEAINATFDLQMKQTDGSWTTVVSGLKTANSYALTWNDDGKTATEADTGDLDEGQLTVTGLTWNTYRFVETSTDPGYLPDDANGDKVSSAFTIDRNTPNMAVGVTVQNAQTSLELNKQNEVGDALSGAKFTVTPVGNSVFADGTTAAKTMTSDSSGHAVLNGQLVVGGTYEIYEQTAPTGYDPVDAKFQVYVQENGNLDVVGGDATLSNGWERADVDGDGTVDNQFSFIATNNHLAIQLEKVSSGNGGPLENVTFRLNGMCMDNNSSHDFTTDKDGVIQIDPGLRAGVEYTLYETSAPNGYIQMTEPLVFYMDERGEIDVVGDVPEGWTVGDDNISLTAANDPVNLQITKVNPDGGPLFGAVFSITPVDGSTFADGTTDTETLRTGEDGSLFMGAKLVVGNSYDITEASAPEGYEKVSGTMRVTVADDGSINVVGSVDENGQVTGQLPPTGYEKVFGNAFEVQVTNEPVEITINKVKSGDGGTRLNGAVFEVTGVFANSNAESTREFTTDTEGNLVGVANISAQLKSGETYVLSEKTAPSGYELIEGTLTFTVNEDGTITPQGNVPVGYSIEQSNVSIVAADSPIDLAFFKKDLGNDNELAGAEFTLSGIFVDNATHETSQLTIGFTTAGTAISFGNLSHEGNTYSIVAGQTYVLTETKAPSGYELLEPFNFTVGTDGTIAPAEGSSQAVAGEEGYVISNDQGGAVTLTAHDKPIEVVLAKVSSANEQLALTGAVFELYRGASVAEGVFVEQVSTGTNGKVALENLVGGTTYTLNEVTAPAGYELLPDVTFTVETDGTVTLSENAPAGYTVTEGEDGVVTFMAADTPIEAQLVKTDEAGTPLAGAVFSIQGTFAGGYAQERKITLDPTDEDGITSIPVAALIANETYTIAELTAPDGYERAGNVKFTVATDGTITILSDDANAASGSNNTATGDTNVASGGNNAMASNGGASAVAGTNGTGTFAASSKGTMAVITATNHPVEITITKTDGAQGLLPGAEFTATSIDGAADGAGAHSVTAVTGEDGVAVLSGLIAGKEYTLAETKAPAGYELLTDTLTFTVQPDGTIDTGLLPPAAFSIGTTKDAVSVTDNPLEVSLVKQAPNGAPLAGAEFTVEGEFPDGQTSKTFTSNESGIVFNQLQLTGSAEGTRYSVTETKAPDGYAQPEGSLDLLVYEDGSVQIAESSSADMKQYASVAFTSGTAVVTLNNEPLPGTELPQTGDSRIMPILTGAFGLLGLWALVMGGIAYRRFRDIKK